MTRERIAPLNPRPEARRGLDLARQIAHLLRDRGEALPVPILGGAVVEAQPVGRVRVFWRLPGPPLFKDGRRHRHLHRYECLLRSWGLATEVCFDAPEPYVACWFA